MTEKYNFTHSGKNGKWEVKIDKAAQYGYFEHDLHGQGGGLWFENDDLQDYDGVWELPKGVREMIKALGFQTTTEDEQEAEEAAAIDALKGLGVAMGVDRKVIE